MAVLGILVGTARMFADAWAVWLFWGWFVVPLGAPPVSYWHALGLDLFVGLFFLFQAPRPEEGEGEDVKRLGWALGKLIIVPVVVGLGWLVRGAM